MALHDISTLAIVASEAAAVLVVQSIVLATALCLLFIRTCCGCFFLFRRGSKQKQDRPRAVFITGASGGIGEALALKYAAPGVRLELTGRKADRLQAVAARCRDRGAFVRTHIVDVTDQQGLSKVMLEADGEEQGRKINDGKGNYMDCGPLDLVIANAGVSGSTASLRDSYSEKVCEIFDVNIDGVINSVLPVLERMRDRRRGQLALVSSISGILGPPRAAAYNASKNAVLVFGCDLRAIMKRYDVRVSVIVPGYVESGMSRAALNSHGSVPFIVTAEEAVNRIFAGLERDDGLIIFPWTLYLFVRVLHSLPSPVLEWVSSQIADPSRIDWEKLG